MTKKEKKRLTVKGVRNALYYSVSGWEMSNAVNKAAINDDTIKDIIKNMVKHEVLALEIEKLEKQRRSLINVVKGMKA